MNAHSWSYAISGLALPAVPLVILALAVLRPRSRVAKCGIALTLALLWLCATPQMASWLIRGIESRAPVLDRSRAATAQAVLVLAGGRRSFAPELAADAPLADGTSINGATLLRLHYGIALARELKLPLALAGGTEQGDFRPPRQPMAEHMAHAARLYGVEPQLIERQSRTTREHPPALRAQAPQWRRVILVTSASHMQRAVAIFERAGYAVISAPTGYADRDLDPLFRWFPSAEALAVSSSALREWAGLLRGY